MHNFLNELPEPVSAEVERRSRLRRVAGGEVIYSQGDAPSELYQVLSGSIKLCNYSVDGREFLAGEFRAGDCFGEMGLIDGLPRVSHAVAVHDTSLRVLGRQDFDELNRAFPEFSRQVMLMLCRRVRFLYGLQAEASGLSLHQRLARTLCRLAYSQGARDGAGELYVVISQEELGRMLGVSRQTINKELKTLVEEGAIDLRYGKIQLTDLDGLRERYESLMGSEQITPGYND